MNLDDWKPLRRNTSRYLLDLEAYVAEFVPWSLRETPRSAEAEAAMQEAAQQIAERMVQRVAKTNATSWRAAAAQSHNGRRISTPRCGRRCGRRLHLARAGRRRPRPPRVRRNAGPRLHGPDGAVDSTGRSRAARRRRDRRRHRPRLRRNRFYLSYQRPSLLCQSTCTMPSRIVMVRSA